MAIVDLETLRMRARDASGQLTASQKALLAAALAATVVGLMLFGQLTRTRELAVLYADLDSADAAQVVDSLEARGIEYQLSDGGRTVRVPREQLYATRLDLSAEGIPNGNDGWAILDNQGLTTSEFEQRVGYQRALEGELGRTIMELDGISSATVHLVIPEDDLFVRDAVESSASVLLQAAPGRLPDEGQVQAIVNLVSSAVEGLTPEAVSVADTTGLVLAAPGQGLAGAGLETSHRRTASFERELAASIERMLTPVVGPGHAVVTVNADLDYDEVVTTTETYEDLQEGEEATALTQSTRLEEYWGVDGAANAGVLGAEELPVDDAETLDAEGLTYRLAEDQTEYGIDRVVTSVEKAPGTVSNLSVAVVLDDAAIDAAQASEVESLVAAAAGIDPGRGDSLAVSLMTFDEDIAAALAAPIEDALGTGEGMDLIGLIRTVGLLVVTLVVVIMAWLSLRKGRKLRQSLGTVDLRELDEAAGAIGPGVESPALPDPELFTDPLNEVGDLIDRQPDEVARLLRGWLGDRREVTR
ncbi:MAG: flagellar M-ring protein FliF [Actinomycetia bacterium]|nr:flagellar M-ring protein FliF [Actinomycetes bacterium]